MQPTSVSSIPNDPARARPTRAEREDLWQRSVDLLGIGEGLGRIVTTDPTTVGVESHREIPKQARLWVYNRRFSPCYRCGTEILAWDLGGRSVWACPLCQPG